MIVDQMFLVPILKGRVVHQEQGLENFYGVIELTTAQLIKRVNKLEFEMICR